MRPDNNPELYQEVLASRLGALNEEFVRRNILSTSMAELSEQFDQKQPTSHPVSEPTIFARLYALAQVQRTPVGISGFDAMRAIDFNAPMGGVQARVAPDHDKFTDDKSNTYHTRVISLTIPDTDYADEVDIFGINVYQPDLDAADVTDPVPQADKPGLVVIGKAGSVMGKARPVGGENVVLGVRNKRTNDAKLYRVSFVSAEQVAAEVTSRETIVHESEDRILLVLPDKMVVKIEQLSGKLQQQALSEIHASIKKLKELPNPNNELAEDEKEAADNALRTSSDNRFDGIEV